MSKVKHLRKDEQQIEPLFNGAFTENKPIGFPNRNGTNAYSNIFYWAHLVAHETAEFPLHPHEGFEIITFVFKGSVEHYDTVSQVYTPLNAGDVQAIQAGSGVSHSERITKGTELFQIWFDPDFSKTMSQDATYKDYGADSFHSQSEGDKETLVYIGDKGSVQSITEGLEIQKTTYKNGEFDKVLDSAFTYSYYLLDGEIELDGERLIKDDFYVLQDASSVTFKVKNGAELFMIKTPTEIKYRRFIERYKK
ncbi:pirin family protein [Sulfurimonas sp. SAG-AH-194-L11]|nr:pirin family protein [Sulfurimonas sp. SAG-AH-194-L11]MDF1877700.1 pirin family protein [Sulfurimonas sp. SAG-AH-194-L11]